MAIQTVTLNEGDSYFIPKGATILSITDPDTIGLSSPSGCIETTAPLTVCYRYSWEDVGGDAGYNDAAFYAIKVKTTDYTFNDALALTYDNPTALTTEIERVTPFIEVVESALGAATTTKYIILKVPENVDAPLLLWKNLNPDTTYQYSAMLPTVVDCPAIV